MATIVLDPGHGGTAKIGGSSANNAVGPGGLLEKTVTLQLALHAERILARRGHTVVLTRRTDDNLGLTDRARAAKSIAAPVFVSIHLNGFNNKAQGTETICDTEHGSRSADLCRAMQKRLVTATGHADRNAGHAGGVKRQPLGVLKPSAHHGKTACCLVEISFMDVPAEEARLKTDIYLDRVATALCDGVTDYLGDANLESAGNERRFEDGFAAEGKKPVRVRLESAERGAKARTAARPEKKQQAKYNDAREFRKVEIGEGFDPSSVALESTSAELESARFDMAGFSRFVASLGLRYFSAEELLFLGSSNAAGGACSGRNAPPAQDLWSNIGNTARMLDEIRHRLAAPCRILSAYRNAAYNTCIGGEGESLHMRYNAIDFRCEQGTASQWVAVAKAVRASSPAYRGGIGKYPSFVHIDTRGYDANW